MKPLLLLSLGLALAGCTTIRWTIGMSESDFKSQSRQIKPVEMSAMGDVYSFQTANNGLLYFYFKGGQLIQVDHGERVPDIVIQNNR